MNNRYNYDRRRNYGRKSTQTANGASSVAFLLCVLFAMAIWVVSLKSDIRSFEEDKESTIRKIESLSKSIDSIRKIPKPVPIAIEPEKPKKPFKRMMTKDTLDVKSAEKIEAMPIVVDSIGL